ncbi:uncharacterized protein LOC133441985 [Cololabis saira]|uniref:uncharacterized protein LOC133441985 n=1 Tax=Cololabis saira TaxID=129043 RepID=UPI002AD4132E|nr:uncharacterized protein LOC133441985 [Cololabis saira]
MSTSSNPPLPQDDGLWTFLHNRGVPEEYIHKMQQDRIDSSVVGDIDDVTMTAYIPALGDRIATRRFCMEKQRRGRDDSQRQSLFEKLRRKMVTTSNKDQDVEEYSVQPTKVYLRNNKRALKMTRKIELGWIHNKRQVRKRCGGGTKLMDISKNGTKIEIMTQAKKLFFPNEKSTKGKWEKFSHDIVDFQGAYLEEGVTVGQLYETRKFGVLRFYLLTESLINGDEMFTEMAEGADEQTEAARSDEHQKNTPENDEQLTQKTLPSLIKTEVTFGPSQGGPFLGDLDDKTLIEPILPKEEPEEKPIAYTSTPIKSEPVPAGPPSPTYKPSYVTVKLHKGNLLDELITQFKDEAMMSYSVKYSFTDEKGADADGVSRDVYPAFWTEFLDRAAEGADVRVPSLSTTWQQEEWKSVGRILVKGLRDHGYFPFRLAQAFTAAITFGEHSVSPDLLFDSLMLYLSQSERDVLSNALPEALVGGDEGELLDLMDRMGVRTVPTQENLKAVLLQVAHKQIIQQPKYALDNIAAVAGPTLREFFPSVLEMQKMYEGYKLLCLSKYDDLFNIYFIV